MSRFLFRDAGVKSAAWFHVNAERALVGKLAARVAVIISGKHKPVYNPGVDCGDNVVVTNVRDVRFSGKKLYQKHYRWHTQWMGGLTLYPAQRMMAEQYV
jgi:large subunit ribosomal protein L13